MVTANKDSNVRRFTGSAVVFMEVAYGTELLGNRHAVEIVGVANCLCSSIFVSNDLPQTDLEVAPNDEEVDAIPVVDFTGLLDGCIDSMESAVALCNSQSEHNVRAHQTYAAFNCNPHRFPSYLASLRPRQC